MSYGDDTCKEARENGYDDGFFGEPYENPYKNFDQAQEYSDGYQDGKQYRLKKESISKIKEL